jgi:hypothetical protein
MSLTTMRIAPSTSAIVQQEVSLDNKISLVRDLPCLKQQMELKLIWEELFSNTGGSYPHYSIAQDIPLCLYKTDNRLIVRFCVFNPHKFSSMLDLSHSETVQDLKSISNEFYSNQISISQYNIHLSVITKILNNLISIRIGPDISLNMADHIYGDPMHLSLDVTELTTSTLQTFTNLLSITNFNG